MPSKIIDDNGMNEAKSNNKGEKQVGPGHNPTTSSYTTRHNPCTFQIMQRTRLYS